MLVGSSELSNDGSVDHGTVGPTYEVVGPNTTVIVAESKTTIVKMHAVLMHAVLMMMHVTAGAIRDFNAAIVVMTTSGVSAADLMMNRVVQMMAAVTTVVAIRFLRRNSSYDATTEVSCAVPSFSYECLNKACCGTLGWRTFDCHRLGY